VLGLDDVDPGREVLGEEFAVVFVLLTLLGVVGLLDADDGWGLLLVDLVELYLLEDALSIVVMALEAGDEAIAVGFGDGDDDDVDHCSQHNAEGRVDLAVGVDGEHHQS